jgi:hypothetical protein
MTSEKRQMWLEKREDGSIYPCDGESALKWADMKLGKYLFTYKPAKKVNRNIHFHGKYFKMLQVIFDNQEKFPSIDSLRKAVIIDAGFYRIQYCLDGTFYKEADSISFAKMNQEEFEILYSKSVDVCIKAFGHDEKMFELLMSFL